MPIATKNYFSVKVIKTKSRQIKFGVIDSKYKNQRFTDCKENNIIFYMSAGIVSYKNGEKYYGVI